MQSGQPVGHAGTGVADWQREILVTFTDRGIERTPAGGPGDYHRHSADYQSTAWSQAVSADIARDYALQTVAEWPIRTLGVHCVVFEVRDERPLDEVIGRLTQDRRIGAVQRMNSFRVLGARDPYSRLQTSLDRMQVEAVHPWTTGKGVSVAVIDTGVDFGHPDLAGQVSERADLTGNTGAFGDDIHGTAVAGVIAALSGNGQGIVGVAPGAKIIALRACWPVRPGEVGAVCNSLTLAKALDEAIRLKPRVLNLSLTGPPDPLVEALVRAALEANVIVVAAEPEVPQETGFAGRVAGVIRVRSVADGGKQAQHAPVGAAIAAPGHEVLTTFPHGTYNFISGSSFAAANVSGIVALLLELPARPVRRSGRGVAQ